MVRLPAEGDRIVGGPVDRRRDLEGAGDRRARRGAHLDKLVIVAERLLVRRVEERDVNPAVRRDSRHGDERLIEGARDHSAPTMSRRRHG